MAPCGRCQGSGGGELSGYVQTTSKNPNHQKNLCPDLIPNETILFLEYNKSWRCWMSSNDMLLDSCPLRYKSWTSVLPSANCFTRFHTITSDGHVAPYISFNCSWISVFIHPTAHKNWITLRISQGTYTCNRSPILTTA